MKIEHTTVFGFEAALRGMRNALNSWDKSDSFYGPQGQSRGAFQVYGPRDTPISAPESPWIGKKDMALACKLTRAGSDHRKFLRQIMIWVDLTIPRYGWQELDTYKVATVRNSCSTMHKLGHTDLTPDDFEDCAVEKHTLRLLNDLAKAYREKAEHRIWGGKISGYDLVRFMKGVLPESFLQKATYTMSYETALAAYFARRNHRLDIWREEVVQPDGGPSITSWIRSLPYMEDFILAAEKN